MSHKKIIGTVYRDKDVLEQAFRETCAEFGFTAEVGRLQAQMYNRERVPVSMCIRRNRDFNSWYYGDFGLSAQSDGTFRIIIDDHDERREKVHAFLTELERSYGRIETLKDMLSQGWVMSKENYTDERGLHWHMRPTRRVLEVLEANTKKEPARVAVWR